MEKKYSDEELIKSRAGFTKNYTEVNGVFGLMAQRGQRKVARTHFKALYQKRLI